MPQNLMIIRPVHDLDEAKQTKERIDRLLERADPNREFIAERPLSSVRSAIEDGYFILCENRTGELVGCLALYPINEDENLHCGYELGTVMVDKSFRRYRLNDEGLITYAIIATCLSLILSNRINMNIFAYVRENNSNPDRVLQYCGFRKVDSDKKPKKKYELKPNIEKYLAKILSSLDFDAENIFLSDSEESQYIKFEGWIIDNDIISELAE